MEEKIGKFYRFVENTKTQGFCHAQRIYEILDEIRNSNTLVVVEGKKDRLVLNMFGIDNIVELSKKPLFEIVEDISNFHRECIILTDLDKKGKELYGKLNSNLQKNGVRINNKFREFLFKHTKLRQIEGINSYLDNF